MELIILLVVGGLALVFAFKVFASIVRTVITLAIVAFVALAAYYLVVDNAPEPVSRGVKAAAGEVGEASGKAATVLGGKAAEVGAKVGEKAATEAKELGAKAAGEMKEAAGKAAADMKDAAAKGAEAAVDKAVQKVAGEAQPAAK